MMRSRPITHAHFAYVDGSAQLKITERELKTVRGWSAVPRRRAPRWLAQMQKAMRLVTAAVEVHGRDRYDLLVEAAKIMVALREPRTQKRVSFRRSQWLIEVAIGKLGGCVGCLATGVSLANKRLYARVKRVVNAADPIGLLRAGAPDDEYHAEINEIASWLPEPDCRTVAQTNTIVHGVFLKWFGARVAGPRKSYQKLATTLHALRPRRARPHAKLVKQLTQEEALRLARARDRARARRDAAQAGQMRQPF